MSTDVAAGPPIMRHPYRFVAALEGLVLVVYLAAGTVAHRPLSHSQKQVNRAHARQRGPGERANAQLKNWLILRKIRSCPSRACELVAAVQTLMIANV